VRHGSGVIVNVVVSHLNASETPVAL
jgi:hypothetical protein